MKNRRERQEQFEKLDRWLDNLYQAHPFLFNFLSLALAAVLFGAAMLFKFLLELLAKEISR